MTADCLHNAQSECLLTIAWKVLKGPELSHLQIAGGWNQDAAMQVYGQLPTGDSLAQRGTFTKREAFMVFHPLLSPADFPEFKGMADAIFPEAKEVLVKIQQVLTNAARIQH